MHRNNLAEFRIQVLALPRSFRLSHLGYAPVLVPNAQDNLERLDLVLAGSSFEFKLSSNFGATNDS